MSNFCLLTDIVIYKLGGLHPIKKSISLPMPLEGESVVLTPEKSLCSHQLDQDFVREKLFMLEVRRDLNVDICHILTDTLETVEKDAKNTMKHLDEKLH